MKGLFIELWAELWGPRTNVGAPRDQQREKMFPGMEEAWKKQYFGVPLRTLDIQEMLPDTGSSQRGI